MKTRLLKKWRRGIKNGTNVHMSGAYDLTAHITVQYGEGITDTHISVPPPVGHYTINKVRRMHLEKLLYHRKTQHTIKKL